MKPRQVKEAWLNAYEITWGHIGKACDAVKIHRHTYYEWIKKDDWFKAEVDAIDEKFLDSCEAKLKEVSIQRGELPFIKEWLSNKGKSRGWGLEKQELNHSGSVELKITREVIKGGSDDSK
jgi:hypothetical protein